MIIPDPIIFAKPLHIWLGILALLLLVLQILVGIKVVKLPFWTHMKLIWVVLILVALIHGAYGFSIYFHQ